PGGAPRAVLHLDRRLRPRPAHSAGRPRLSGVARRRKGDDSPVSTSAHTTTSAGRDFPELDAIRFVAALGVVVTHTAFFAGLYTRGTWGVATQRLEVGVAVFFVLSGFLLGLPYVRTALGGRPPQPLRAYARKRVLRIMPV